MERQRGRAVQDESQHQHSMLRALLPAPAPATAQPPGSGASSARGSWQQRALYGPPNALLAASLLLHALPCDEMDYTGREV